MNLLGFVAHHIVIACFSWRIKVWLLFSSNRLFQLVFNQLVLLIYEWCNTHNWNVAIHFYVIVSSSNLTPGISLRYCIIIIGVLFPPPCQPKAWPPWPLIHQSALRDVWILSKTQGAATPATTIMMKLRFYNCPTLALRKTPSVSNLFKLFMKEVWMFARTISMGDWLWTKEINC